MVEVGRQYIEEVFDNMIDLVGVKENIPCHLLTRLFYSGEIKKCVKKIAEYLGLPIEVNLFNVSSSSYGGDGQGFVSNQLTKTDGSGRSKEGITAQVIIPPYVPIFGSKELIGFPIDVKISKNIREYPDTFFAIMAHELFHVVIHSLHLTEKDNEIYTDIGAMLSGFNEIMREGRDVVKEHREYDSFSEKIITETTKYGYLSDSDFWFVYDRINRLLRENRNKKKKILSQIDFLKEQIAISKKNISKFRNYIKLLNKNLKRKINPIDVEKIVLFHQPDYFDEFEKTVEIVEKVLQEDYDFIKPKRHYYKDLFKKTEERLAIIKSDIEKRKELIKKDLQICERNIGFIDKARLCLSMFLKES